MAYHAQRQTALCSLLLTEKFDPLRQLGINIS
jgi:hypothetical protein